MGHALKVRSQIVQYAKRFSARKNATFKVRISTSLCVHVYPGYVTSGLSTRGQVHLF